MSNENKVIKCTDDAKILSDQNVCIGENSVTCDMASNKSGMVNIEAPKDSCRVVA